MKEGALGDSPRPRALHGADVKREEFTGKKDQTLEFSQRHRPQASKVLLVGLGKVEALTEADVRVFAARAARFANAAKATSLAIELPAVAGAERTAAEGAVLGAYRFTK